MIFSALDRRSLAITLALGVATALAGCGSKEQPATTAQVATPAPEAAAPAAAPAPAPAPISATDVANASWTPEALEELLAPIALYPDPVLSQVLIAATNPQEVLDAGNWLIANEGLTGKTLDEGAAKAGFTPPIRALVQFPQTIDLMCMEMGWTTELGQAFVADQAGVLDAIQRLRRQAMDVGNLKSSEAMQVQTQVQEGKEVVVLSPPKPEVVYVPQYDPQAVYAPAPAVTTTTVPATTTTVVEQKSGHSTGALVTTGLLSFGAGILVNELFDDDDDDYRHGYYYPNYGYGGMPYYPPYPYRPSYGGGYYPSNGYNRPPNYNNGGFQNNGNIIINNPGGGGGGYWDRYPNNTSGSLGGNNKYKQPRAVKSPISAAKPNRPELQQLNKQKPRPMPANAKRPTPNTTASNWKGQSSYAGKDKRPVSAKSPQDRINAATPGYSKPAANARPPSAKNRPQPKVQGSYAGKDMNRPATKNVPKPAAKPAARPATKPAARPVSKPQNMPSGDRGYGGGSAQRPMAKPAAKPMPANRPTAKPAAKPMPVNRPSPSAQPRPSKPTAMSGANRGGGNAKAASQRGKQSMPQGARSKGGGGGGKKKAR